jgi:5-methylcytosine-specific restriction endonuclease McrA
MRGTESSKQRCRKFFEEAAFEDLSNKLKKRRILKEQNGVCLHCGLNEWNGKSLILELDHIDGNKHLNKRENLRILCPNCHSQTPTWKKKKKPV